ncbi:hypothetical protein SAMN02745243_01275 [Hespellia stercorisuis DSM 15480]|uniref:Zinc-ribbon domain-containing protein n=2 Tax=Hespellia stercorisuis TaxID=180311 RepID=A0A1M6LVE4_9FIRM|nr:hypothetical protein SAMN02745243_01275 [Hespellia stercorisuis DSM 15480]
MESERDKIDFDDEQSLKNGLLQVDKTEKRLGFPNPKLRRDIEEKLEFIDKTEKSVCTIKIDDINTYSTVDGKRIICESRELAVEARKVRAEMVQLAEVVANNRKNSDNLKRLYVQLQELNSKFQLGNDMLVTLEKMIADLDASKFMVNGVRYETVEEADEVRKRTVEKNTFDSVEEAAIYRGEHEQLVEILNRKLPDLDAKIQAYKEIVNKKWTHEKSRKEIQEYAEQIKEEYYQMVSGTQEKGLTSKFILKLILWALLCLIALLIGLPRLLYSGWFMKIVIIIIYYNIYVKVKDCIEDYILDKEIDNDTRNDIIMARRLIEEKNGKLLLRGTNICIGDIALTKTNRIYCTKCGQEIEETWLVCPCCGYEILR